MRRPRTPPEDVVSAEDARAMNLRLEVHGAMALAMLHEDLRGPPRHRRAHQGAALAHSEPGRDRRNRVLRGIKPR
jgi:hypothetical protein